jgi:hypothetical protein
VPYEDRVEGSQLASLDKEPLARVSPAKEPLQYSEASTAALALERALSLSISISLSLCLPSLVLPAEHTLAL